MHRAYLDAAVNGWAKQPIIEMLIPSTLDTTLAPKGKHVASLFCQHFRFDLGPGPQLGRGAREGGGPDHRDRRRARAGLRQVGAWRQIHSPLDLERRFGLIGGDIFHGKMGLDQLFSARPMIGAADYRMPLKGLYLCGSGAHPGGGVTGASGPQCRARGAGRPSVLEAAGIEAARRDQGARSEPRARRAVVHAIARRPRRGSHQDRAAGRGRRYAPLGSAMARRRGRARRGLFPQLPTAARNRRRSISPSPMAPRWCASSRPMPTCWSRISRSAACEKFGLDAGIAARRQPAPGLCLDHRLRPGRPLCRPRRL